MSRKSKDLKKSRGLILISDDKECKAGSGGDGEKEHE